MPIVYCKNCGKKNRAPDSAISKKAQCPACKSVMVIPDRDELPPDRLTTNNADEPPSLPGADQPPPLPAQSEPPRPLPPPKSKLLVIGAATLVAILGISSLIMYGGVGSTTAGPQSKQMVPKLPDVQTNLDGPTVEPTNKKVDKQEMSDDELFDADPTAYRQRLVDRAMASPEQEDFEKRKQRLFAAADLEAKRYPSLSRRQIAAKVFSGMGSEGIALRTEWIANNGDGKYPSAVGPTAPSTTDSMPGVTHSRVTPAKSPNPVDPKSARSAPPTNGGYWTGSPPSSSGPATTGSSGGGVNKPNDSESMRVAPESPKPSQTVAKAKSLLNMARNYVNAGDLVKAKEYAQRLITEYPNAAEVDDAKAILNLDK